MTAHIISSPHMAYSLLMGQIHEFVFLTDDNESLNQWGSILSDLVRDKTPTDTLYVLFDIRETTFSINYGFVLFKQIVDAHPSFPFVKTAYLHNMQPNLISQVQTMARLTHTQHHERGFFNADERDTAVEWLLSSM